MHWTFFALVCHYFGRLVPMLGSPAAMADCYLSRSELAKDADAVKLVRAVERLGVAVKGFRLPSKHRPNPYHSALTRKTLAFPSQLPKEVRVVALTLASIARGDDAERPTLYPGFAVAAEE